MGHGREGDGDRGGTSSGTTVYDAGMESTSTTRLYRVVLDIIEVADH